MPCCLGRVNLSAGPFVQNAGAGRGAKGRFAQTHGKQWRMPVQARKSAAGIAD
jgi:hypothetical protein